MSRKVLVAGVGMIPFVKPGQNLPCHEMGAEAARLALADAGINYSRVQQELHPEHRNRPCPPSGEGPSSCYLKWSPWQRKP